MDDALIFNIQKFSLNDGDGIRTTVFFKGCPLRCRWCANPESQIPTTELMWDSEKCRHCGKCASVCPVGAITCGQTVTCIDNSCTGCSECITHCPEGAISAEGKRYTVEEIVELCLRDRAFYEESGGGVTLSGGEPLYSPQTAERLINALSREGIDTAVETTGFAPPEVFDAVTAKAGLLLFDMKHWDEKKHIEGTGVSNCLIISNLRRAIAAGKRVLPRIPVIPDYNDSLDDAQELSRLLKEVGAGQVQLLPFHQFGERKYELLGREYAYSSYQPLSEDKLKDYREVFIRNGVHAFF